MDMDVNGEEEMDVDGKVEMIPLRST